MSTSPPTDSLAELRHEWQLAWPRALNAWSRHVLLRAPLLCIDTQEAAREGLIESFAMIRLVDQAVVIDLTEVRRRGLESYAVEILAHEIGHHVLAPASLTEHARSLARMRRALPTLEAHAPVIANLYTDLLINDRLQRSAGLRLAEVFGKLAAGGRNQDVLWSLYLRTYELLWSLPRGQLGGGQLSEEAEGDAWLAMRLVRHHARNWLEGAAKFAMLVLPYLVRDRHAGIAGSWHDTRAAGAGGEPSGLTDADDDEQPLIHPALDADITGAQAAPTDAASDAAPVSGGDNLSGRHGQARQPFEYGEILRAAGVTLSDQDLAVLYYREKAAPHLVRFPARSRPRSIDPLPEGLAPWDVGESFETIDWLQSVLQSPRIIPGVTTVQRIWGESPGASPASVPLDLDVYIDSSGSMPNPQTHLSFPTLAGAILCLSALRAGARVQITVWSGKQQVTSTPGFIRDAQQAMRVLISYFGGATQFPLPTLRQTYLGAQPRSKPTHLLVISDDGVTTVFDRDEQGTAGWDLLRTSLEAGKGGATFVLNLAPDWESRQFPQRDMLLQAREQLGVQIYRIDAWEQLVNFAREFSRRAYHTAARKMPAQKTTTQKTPTQKTPTQKTLTQTGN